MTTTGSENSAIRSSDPGMVRWRVWVDWSGQGIWGASNVDVSGDVLGIRWRWGRCGLPVPEFAPPAQLELALRNPDHRYTPGNTSGILGSDVRPGREVWLRASRIYDGFDTPTTAPANLHGRTATGSDGGWDVLGVPGNGFVAADGVVTGQAGGWPPSDSVALLDTGDPLATLTARYRRGSDGLGGFALRCMARDNTLRLRFSNSETFLERVSGRRVARLATGSPLDRDAWYDLEIQQSGGGVLVFATRLDTAGTVRRRILAATPIIDAPQSGRHGLWHAFRNARDGWSDFNVGRSLFVGSITATQPDRAAAVCRISAADAMEPLESEILHRKLAGALMRSGSVGAAILGWAGLTPHDYALDAGRLLLTGGPRSVWDVSAARALRRLQREENGLIYVDGVGRVRLEAATVRSAIRSHQDPASLAAHSIGDAASGSAPHATALARDDGADAVEDAVAFRYRRSSDAGRQQVWTLNETLEIPAGGEQIVLVSTDTWDVIDGLVAPTATTDYTATDDAEGDGADVTGDITVSLLAEAQSGIAGRGHAVRISNGGANTAYLQTLRIHANHCWRTQSSSAARAGAASVSQVAKIARGSLIRCRYADNYAAARGAAQARFAERSVRRTGVALTLPLRSAANRRPVVEGRLTDVVSVNAATHGITGAWLIEGMEVNVAGGGEGEARWWLTAV